MSPSPPPNTSHDQTTLPTFKHNHKPNPNGPTAEKSRAATEAQALAADPDPETSPTSLLATLEAEEASLFPSRSPSPSFSATTTHPNRELLAQRHAEELRHARQYPTTHASTTPLVQQLLGGGDGDDAVLQFTTQNHTCLVHFSHPDFARCSVMQTHLERLAARHAGEVGGAGAGAVRFAAIDVRTCPFVVEKLGIRVLPCLVGFRDGVGVGRVVGFEGLPGGLLGGGGEGGVGVTRAIEGVVVGWGVFGGRTRGWGVGNGGSSGEEEEEEEEEVEEQQRRKKGGLFGKLNGRRKGFQGRKKGVADRDEEEDDDDWD